MRFIFTLFALFILCSCGENNSDYYPEDVLLPKQQIYKNQNSVNNGKIRTYHNYLIE